MRVSVCVYEWATNRKMCEWKWRKQFFLCLSRSLALFLEREYFYGSFYDENDIIFNRNWEPKERDERNERVCKMNKVFE